MSNKLKIIRSRTKNLKKNKTQP